MHERQTVSLDTLRARRGDDAAGHVFFVLITAAVGLAFFMVGAVGVDVVVEAWDILTERLWDFLGSPSSADEARSGVSQGIRGSILIAAIVILTFPVGIHKQHDASIINRFQATKSPPVAAEDASLVNTWAHKADFLRDVPIGTTLRKL